MPEVARVLVYDIEVSPTLGWTYGQWQTNVLRVEREPHLLCFAYHWLGEDASVKCVSLVDFPARYTADPYDDSLVVKALWALLDEAEVVVGHSANGFDNRVANERFLYHRLGPVSPYGTVDTLQVARRMFREGSNSLDNLCRKLDIGGKPEKKHAQLWRSCIDGDATSWMYMVEYCKEDVRLCEELYLRVRPFIPNPPNMALISGTPGACPKCGSSNLQKRGVTKSLVGTYQRVRCMTCGGWSRARLGEKNASKPEFR